MNDLFDFWGIFNCILFELEAAIDHWDATVPPLQAFILPSGAQAGCRLHMARSVCRRAERQLVSLLESMDREALTTEAVYLNRLSDLLFVLARAMNQIAGQTETQWQANRENGSDWSDSGAQRVHYSGFAVVGW